LFSWVLAEHDAGNKLQINLIILFSWVLAEHHAGNKLISNTVLGFWQNMIQETMISKDGDFGKHCLEIWQLCFAIFFFTKILCMSCIGFLFCCQVAKIHPHPQKIK
jgi:hypothetical protein